MSDYKKIKKELMEMSDEALAHISFRMPVAANTNTTTETDADGFSIAEETVNEQTRKDLQTLCWEKFQSSPHLNTSVRGLQGRITGKGFKVSSEDVRIDDVIHEITYDQRNRLYNFTPKYVARAFIEGELFQCLTIHTDGFVEVDFIDPTKIGGEGEDSGDEDSGIIFHPTKTHMPLFYNIINDENEVIEQIPSIYIGRYPSMRKTVVRHKSFRGNLQNRKPKGSFAKLGGYQKFIVSWDKSFITRRAVSYLKTTIQWLNHYETLKQYEIDHKKSAGAYLWVFSIEEPAKFKQWLAMTDKEKADTGIYAAKEAGGSLVLPAGMKVSCINPQLSAINEQDTDILNMIASGLNEPTDIMTGNANGTFASTKATRGPMSDRTSDEVAYFDRFWKYDFWSSIFFLKAVMGKFPEKIKKRRCIGFKNKKPIFAEYERTPEHFIDIDYPTSELIDLEGRVKALTGSKHGPLSLSLGLSRKETAEKIGIGGYGKQRRIFAEEEEYYPKLPFEMGIDAESLQDKTEGEQPKEKNKEVKKSVKNIRKKRRRTI
jgi:hypothetical protein